MTTLRAVCAAGRTGAASGSGRLVNFSRSPMGVALTYRDVATGALCWVASLSGPAGDGVAWPDFGYANGELLDDLYAGTAGVLAGFAEARLSGITEFDGLARAAAARLREVVANWEPGKSADADQDVGLYTGLAGEIVALHAWAECASDQRSADAAMSAARAMSAAACNGALTSYRDVISGEAGVLLALIAVGADRVGYPANKGPGEIRAAIAAIADRLVAGIEWVDGEPDWRMVDGYSRLMPNFSHGAAGIGFALARAAELLDRCELLDIAEQAGRRLVRLGSRPDGTLAVPNAIPPSDAVDPVSYGWCHGPTGTLRLFEILDRLLPGQGWAGHAEACRQAVRTSGLPARLYPGFWDNIGRCCGTAGVGDMALDRYCETGDAQWLDWAETLADDIVGRSISDHAGTRWSQTEHRADPPQLVPEVGWMQGAAGIASFLLRLDRAREQGTAAKSLPWP